MNATHGPSRLAVAGIDNPGLGGFRKEGPHGQGLAARIIDHVGAE
jgi:hypothetical protein